MTKQCKHVGFPIRGRQSTCSNEAKDGHYCEVHAPLYRWQAFRRSHEEPERKYPPIEPLKFH